MTETMYDGINSLAAGIARQFPNATKVAGYINGLYAWSDANWALFPRSEHVTISITARANAGDVLDVETGDAAPDQTAGWIAMRKAAGLWRPTVYCSRDVVPAVRIGTGKWVLGRDYDLWVADYTGQPHQAYPGCAATQYESTPGWDASLVHDPGWPHRQPPVPPAPTGESGTPHEIVNLAWSAIPGKGYQWELAASTGGKVGGVVKDGNVMAAAAVVHVEGIDVGQPGPFWWRVRELPDGAWSAWGGLKG